MAAEDIEWQAKVDASWQEPTLVEIGLQQDITKPQKLDELLGAGRHLWTSDKEFDDFLDGIYERRRGIYKPE